MEEKDGVVGDGERNMEGRIKHECTHPLPTVACIFNVELARAPHPQKVFLCVHNSPAMQAFSGPAPGG